MEDDKGKAAKAQYLHSTMFLLIRCEWKFPRSYAE